MAGKYTEAQKRAQINYYNKLKESGVKQKHGDPIRNKQTTYANNALLLIKKLFKDAPF